MQGPMTVSSGYSDAIETSGQASGRLALLDLARGLAVIAMVIYHFSWDLSWFAFVDWQVADAAGWRTFAISIAASFLFLAGISLDLAHHRQIRWRSFWKREAIILAAAASVSLGTYFALPEIFVRFGILHCIAASSLIALPFTRLSMFFSAVAGVTFFALPHLVSTNVFDGDLWLWTGLGAPASASVDYVPLAPWTGATLLGITASQMIRRSGLLERLSTLRFSGRPGLLLRWMGRHSLPIYLLHQPVLFGLVWSVTVLVPGMDTTSRSFQTNCTATCTQSLNNEPLCKAACACTLTGLKTQNVWEPLLATPQDPSLQTQMSALYSTCLADPQTYAR